MQRTRVGAGFKPARPRAHHAPKRRTRPKGLYHMHMRCEDFTIDGIPDGYIVYDVDLTPSGRPVPVVAHPTDDSVSASAILNGKRLDLGRESVWRTSFGHLQLALIVRCIGEDRILVTGGHAESDGELNAFVISGSGAIERQMHLGTGVSEVLASEKWLVVGYSDQGVYDDIAVSKEGISVFDLAGTLRLGYRSHFGHAGVSIADVYCASWCGDDEFVFFAYDLFNPSRVDLKTMSQTSWQAPSAVAGSQAISAEGDHVYFHGRAGSPQDMMSLRRPPQIIECRWGAQDWTVVGEWPAESVQAWGHRSLRGLPGGRFIAPKPDGYTIFSFD